MQEREEQSAEVEQTNLSFLSDPSRDSIDSQSYIITLHVQSQSTRVKVLRWKRVKSSMMISVQ